MLLSVIRDDLGVLKGSYCLALEARLADFVCEENVVLVPILLFRGLALSDC